MVRPLEDIHQRGGTRIFLATTPTRIATTATIIATPNQARASRQLAYRHRNKWEASGEVVSCARDKLHAGSIAPGHDAEAVVFDLVNPAGAGRRSLGGRRQARFDNAQPRAAHAKTWVLNRN